MNVINALSGLLKADTGAATSTPASQGASSAGTSGTDSASSSTGTSASSATQDASDRFLTLLVTQLQNQDPLNPLDNAEITTQLAQISTVDGINKLNDTVSNLATSMAANQYLQAVGLVGHQVAMDGNGIDLAGGTASGGINLSGNADKIVVTINDASGAVVRTITLGAESAGTQTFAWDGKNDAGKGVADGHYTFTATATMAGTPVAASTVSMARVTGIVPGASQLTLLLAGGAQVTMSQISQIL